MDPAARLIVALDVEELPRAHDLVTRLGGVIQNVKVGLELFTATGPEAVRSLAARGMQIMLDLKLHDIPETVERATRRAGELGINLFTVHTAGGRKMLEAAVRGAGGKTKILGVTVLTSLSGADLTDIGDIGDVEAVVLRRTQLAVEAGLDGVVASPREAAMIRAKVPAGFLIVTPGVRPMGDASHDQKRPATPRAARQAGADYVVVGRPIRDAADPRLVATAIINELE